MGDVLRFGDSVPPNEPHVELIDLLEQLLSEAKAGGLRALAYVAVSSNNRISTNWDCADGTRYMVGSGIGVLQTRYSLALMRSKG